MSSAITGGTLMCRCRKHISLSFRRLDHHHSWSRSYPHLYENTVVTEVRSSAGVVLVSTSHHVVISSLLSTSLHTTLVSRFLLVFWHFLACILLIPLVFCSLRCLKIWLLGGNVDFSTPSEP